MATYVSSSPIQDHPDLIHVQTVLVPQPSDDPNDPLNWSWKKKHTMLALCSLSAFLADYSSACGIPTIVLQGVEWHKSPNKVNYAGNLNVIML
jgi:hypothetical protein